MTRKSRDFVFRWNSPASLASRLQVEALIHGIPLNICKKKTKKNKQTKNNKGQSTFLFKILIG
jgi:RNase H-fold protein (predicted Holliday junction resolvase)